MKRGILIVLLWVGCLSTASLAQDQVEVINEAPKVLKDTNGIDLAKAELDSKQVPKIIERTIGERPGKDKDPYYIIHVLRWKWDGGIDLPEIPTLETQNWYLYHDGTLLNHASADGLRIYGSRNVSVLYLHLNVPLKKKGDYERVAYRVEVTKKLPAPLQNLNLLFGLITGVSAQGDIPNVPIVLWGGRHLTIRHIPSDITIRAVLGSKTGQEPEKQTEIAKQTYDNEGRYYWDISAGLPLKSVNELEYVATDGIIRAKKIERQNVYAFLNLYPRPVDTKNFKTKEFFKYPGFIVGLPIKGKPLERPIVGGGFLLYRVQVFAGVAFNKIREPQKMMAGQMSTQAKLESDLKTKYQPKFVWGINVPIRQVVDALKAKK